MTPDTKASHYIVQRLTDRRYTPGQSCIPNCLKIAKSLCRAYELGAALYSVAPFPWALHIWTFIRLHQLPPTHPHPTHPHPQHKPEAQCLPCALLSPPLKSFSDPKYLTVDFEANPSLKVISSDPLVFIHRNCHICSNLASLGETLVLTWICKFVLNDAMLLC